MKHALLTGLLGLMALAAGGCNCTCQYLHCLKQQLCCCDPCGGHACDCADCAPPPCECPDCAPPPCDCGHADCGLSLGCLDCCSQGCGEKYYGDWFVGEHCDPCDCHGNWVGPSRYVGHPVGPAAGPHGPIEYGPHGPIMPGPRVIGSRPKSSPAPAERG